MDEFESSMVDKLGSSCSRLRCAIRRDLILETGVSYKVRACH